MKIKKRILLSGLVAGILIGCGGGGGSEAVTGTVSDGYLYKAKVCYLNTDICTYTNIEGKFTLEKHNAPLVAYPENNETVNTVTTQKYNSVLIAPAGITHISPVSTALYSVGSNYSDLAKALDINETDLKNYINKDFIELSENNDTIAKIIYGKSVLLERAVESFMVDSNSTDRDKKMAAVKSLIQVAIDFNKSLVTLNNEDIKVAYEGYKTLVGEPVSEINKTYVSNITSAITSLIDNNFSVTDVKSVEMEMSKLDFKKLLNLDDENLTIALNSFKTLIISYTDNNKTSKSNVAAAYNLLKETAVNITPEINATFYKYIKDSNITNIILKKGEDFNLTEGAVFSVKIDENTQFLTIDGETVAFDKTGDINLTINRNIMKNFVEKAIITLTPKMGDIVGDEKQILILVKNTETSEKILAKEINFDDNVVEINISADPVTHQLNEENKTIDIKINDDKEFVFAVTSNKRIAEVDYNSTDVIITPVSNGKVKIVTVAWDNTYTPKFRTYELNISGIDLPPILLMDKSSYTTVLNPENKSVDVNISYKIKDADNVENGYFVEGCDKNVTSKEGNLTCSFDEPGLYMINVRASDGYLYSAPSKVYVNVIEGNIPPVLSLFVPDKVDMDTMTSKIFTFSAYDLNGNNTFDVNATSSDESIVKVVVDKENKTIMLLAQPKVGTAVVKVWAEDNKGAKSKEYTFSVVTHNKLAQLMPSLYVVPPIKDGKFIDGRYELINFKAQYNIAGNEVLINGEINTTDGNVSLNDFALISYPEEAFYAGKGETVHGYQYGFIFANGFEYTGQFEGGRVLVFSMEDINTTEMNESIPYYWALATKDEICKAFGENNDTINLINSLNDNTPIECK